jgi:hypothetical protein
VIDVSLELLDHYKADFAISELHPVIVDAWLTLVSKVGLKTVRPRLYRGRVLCVSAAFLCVVDVGGL